MAQPHDQQRIEQNRHTHRTGEHQKGRPRITGRAERGLDGEEPEHQWGAQQPGGQIGVAERRTSGGTVMRRNIVAATAHPATLTTSPAARA